MAGTLKPVRFRIAWRHYQVGDEITPNGVLRDWLISNGYCEELLPGKRGPVRDKAKAAEQARGGLFTR
jgi:hypothetical protein